MSGISLIVLFLIVSNKCKRDVKRLIAEEKAEKCFIGRLWKKAPPYELKLKCNKQTWFLSRKFKNYPVNKISITALKSDNTSKIIASPRILPNLRKIKLLQ